MQSLAFRVLGRFRAQGLNILRRQFRGQGLVIRVLWSVL